MRKMKLKTSAIIIMAVLFLLSSTALAGDLNPPGAPSPTMHTLDEIYYKINAIAGSSSVPKTGQKTSYSSGDDGDLQKGVAWPNPRFTDNADGTVTDNLTGLIWLKDANRFGTKTWTDALSSCNQLADDTADLTDGSSPGDWRLPNLRELLSLIDYGRFGPALPSDHPFTGVQSSYYWLSTTFDSYTNNAWLVGLNFGDVSSLAKTSTRYVWAVRGEQ